MEHGLIFVKPGCTGCEDLLLVMGAYKSNDGTYKMPPGSKYQIFNVETVDGLAMASMYDCAQGPFPMIFEDGVVGSGKAMWSGYALTPQDVKTQPSTPEESEQRAPSAPSEGSV